MKNSEKLSRLFQQAGCNLFDPNDKDDRRLVADMPYNDVTDALPDTKIRRQFIRQIAFHEDSRIFEKLLDTFKNDEEMLETIILGLMDDEKDLRRMMRDYDLIPQAKSMNIDKKKSALKKFARTCAGAQQSPRRKPKQ